MKNWYNSLSQRERMLVVYGLIVASIILLWLLAVKPIYNNHLKLNKTIEQQYNTLSLMQKQSLQIKQLQQQSLRKPASNTSQNPQQLIERSLQTWRLKTSLVRMQSQGKGVRLILNDADADRVMRFLYELENQHALVIDSMAISTNKKASGLADFRLTITSNQSQ